MMVERTPADVGLGQGAGPGAATESQTVHDRASAYLP
jgi:hypothetical protein